MPTIPNFKISKNSTWMQLYDPFWSILRRCSQFQDIQKLYLDAALWAVLEHFEAVWRISRDQKKLEKSISRDFLNFVFFGFYKSGEWRSKVYSYSQDEMSTKHFSSDEKVQKTVKKWFYSFFHHRALVSQRHSQKKQKVKTVFASILTPKCVFLKIKM